MDRPTTWMEAETKAEEALRQHDAAEFAVEPMRTLSSTDRRIWVQNWLAEHCDYERLLEEYIGADRQTAPAYLRFSAMIIALVRVPWTPHPNVAAERVVDEIHMLISDAMPSEPDLDDEGYLTGNYNYSDYMDFTHYVKERIPAGLLRQAAADPQWHGPWTGSDHAIRELRAGFAERFVVERSNVTARFAQRFGTPIATLITMFVTARIDQTPEGLVVQRPMVQRYFPPVVVVAETAPAAAASSNRRRGASDNPEGHIDKKGKE